MQKNRRLWIVSILAALSALTLYGCSSTEVSDAELPQDDIPIVDAGGSEAPVDEAPPTYVDTEAPAPESMSEAPVAEAPPPSFDAPVEDSTVVADHEAPPSLDEAAVPPASSGSGSLYEVQQGDTLMKIAYKVYGDIYQWKKILDDNRDRIANPIHLVAGTQLQVDQPAQDDDFSGYERYLIKNGDTLGLISDDVYGTKRKWRKLWKFNDRLIKDPNRIFAGFWLRYMMTEQERQDAERLKSNRPAPLASGAGQARQPSSSQ